MSALDLNTVRMGDIRAGARKVHLGRRITWNVTRLSGISSILVCRRDSEIRRPLSS